MVPLPLKACLSGGCALLLAGTAVFAQSAPGYLQSALDRFQSTVDVYTDADAAGNHLGVATLERRISTPKTNKLGLFDLVSAMA
jgi:hypothetical protein